jgi:uncharacterized membrane protein HdeD (DUF308 family)
MSLSKWAGILWLAAALISVVLTVVFRTDQVQWVVTIIAGVAAAIIGVLLIWRPIPGIATWSTVVGVAWLVIYAWFTFQQRSETVAWTTDVFLGALGAIAALVAYRHKAAARESA